MATIKSTVNKMTKTPNKLGFNASTGGLAIFIVAVTVGASYALNRYDNVVTRNINSVKAGQAPVGV